MQPTVTCVVTLRVRGAQQLSRRWLSLRLDAIEDHIVRGAIGAELLIDGASPAAKQRGEPHQHGDQRVERGAVSLQRRPDSKRSRDNRC